MSTADLIRLLENSELNTAPDVAGWDGMVRIAHEVLAATIHKLREQEATITAMSNRLNAYGQGMASECARSAIKAADEFRRTAERTRSLLVELTAVINRDKDGSFFICEEAAPLVEAAQQLLQEGGNHG